MNENYDVIVCGTGLKECILSGLLSMDGKKVLHIDRNPYYGGDCASVNISTIFKLFRNGQEAPAKYGHNRDWNVDLIPKFMMANGILSKLLLYTKVYKYLDWKCLDASYVYQFRKGGIFSSDKGVICKVPANGSEALSSDLMGMFEKRRMKKLFEYCQKYDENDKERMAKFNPNQKLAVDLMNKYSLEESTVDFVGHAIALYLEDSYLQKKAIDVVEKIRLYMNSHGLYGSSPFLYPIYGLGGIPEGFSRLCAIHGGTYMLRVNADSFIFENDLVKGIVSGADKAFAPIVICDPSYAQNIPGRLKKIGQVIRCICLMDHPIPETNNAQSIQIIIPQKQVNRKSDIYISMVSSTHSVCPKGIYVVIISTTVETANPENEIKIAFQIIGPTLEQFINISDIYEPLNDGKSDGLFITRSYDATSHFETTVEDVLETYKRITGKTVDLTNIKIEEEENQ